MLNPRRLQNLYSNLGHFNTALEILKKLNVSDAAGGLQSVSFHQMCCRVLKQQAIYFLYSHPFIDVYNPGILPNYTSVARMPLILDTA